MEIAGLKKFLPSGKDYYELGSKFDPWEDLSGKVIENNRNFWKNKQTHLLRTN